MKNPETTIGGLVSALGAAMMAWAAGALDAQSIGAIFVAAGTLYTGWKAKDATTHSTIEDIVGATEQTNPAAAHRLAISTGVETPK